MTTPRPTTVAPAPLGAVHASANERALEKAKSIPADAIIFDLEDAVAPDAKASARGNAVAAVRSGEYGNRELTIRCNGLDTPWGADDIAAAARRAPSAVVIPKVDSHAYVDECRTDSTQPAHRRTSRSGR